MSLRNDERGYGLVTKSLHWLTVAALLAQFVVGYLLDDDRGGAGGDGGDGGRGRGRGRGRGGAGDDDLGLGDDSLLTVHVVLGLTILTLAVARLVWRRVTPLPPWAPDLSSTEKVIATWTERSLYLCLILIPLTGLSLLLVSDDLLALHVASHLLFFATLTAHLALVLKHQLLDRDHLLQRMT